jgi:hypothetical protein
LLPQFWHAVATRAAPFKRWLIGGAVLGGAVIALIFSTFVSAAAPAHASPFVIFPAFLGTFWCVGLLTIMRQFRRLPSNPSWTERALSWYAAIFSTVWFVVLALGTLGVVFAMLHPGPA